MFKRIERGPLTLRVWTDGYDTDPIATATHVAIRSNAPDDDRIENETDHFLLADDVAWVYATGLTTRHGSHNHRHYHVLCDDFADEGAEHDAPGGEWVGETVAGIFEAKGFDVRVADPDRFPDLGIDAAVPRSLDDFEDAHRLEGYGLTAAEGRPVFVFCTPPDVPMPARWFPPLTHLVNYSYGETEADAVRRMGVMNTENAVIGGWSGDDGHRLVRALADHEAYDIAVREAARSVVEEIEHAPDYEPAYLGEIEYGINDDEYQRVEESPWENAENEDGVTALEMWEGEA